MLFNLVIVNARMKHICRVDGAIDHGHLMPEAVYQSKYKKSVLSVLDRKSSQFASIAQSVISSSMSAYTSASGYGKAVGTAISMGSAGISTAQGVSEVKDLQSYILSAIDSSARSVEEDLPGFAGILQKRSRVTNKDATEIESSLKSQGVISEDVMLGSGSRPWIRVDHAKAESIDSFAYSSPASSSSSFQGGFSNIAKVLQPANNPSNAN